MAATPAANRALLTLLVVAAFLVLGNFHIVSGAPYFLVERDHFGFSDTFASVSDCTSGPKFIAMAMHPSLCAALLRDGIVGNTNSD